LSTGGESPPGALALVTGASSGIGAAFARELDARGYRLALLARRADRLQALSAELSAPATLLPFDLSRRETIAAVLERLDAERLCVDLLVNNAGLGDTGPFAEADPQRVAEQIDVNVRSATLLTRALLPGMLERGRGAIINVVSMSAFQPVPYLAVYGASKAFVLSFTEALAVELEGSGVHVQAVCPGLVQTEFQERAGTDEVLFNKLPATTPESVARASLDALAGRTVRVFPAFADRVTVALQRLAPRRLVLWVGRQLFKPR
jgi:short-subunit dehydrogenase